MLSKKETGIIFCISLILCMIILTFIVRADTPVVRNYLRVKAILKDECPIYLEPSTTSQQIDRAKQFSVVFIFYHDGGSKYIKNGFYRVGKEPDRALGWIPGDKLREWDHRLCLHFSPLVGRQPALVFGNQDNVEVAIRSNTAPDKSQAIAEEPGDVSKNRYSMLLPVLTDLTITTSNQMRRAFQIGYLAGGQSNAPKIKSPAPTGPGGTISVGGEIALLELMFVMDATASMQPYIDGAKKIISKISKRVPELRESGARIGITCYRDYIKNQPAIEFVTKQFCPLTRNLTQVMNALENDIHEAKASSEDYPEAVLDGLYAAITETNWDKQLQSLRTIILVGDASAHPSGHDKNPMNYSLQQVIQTASDNRVRIIAIKIRSGNESDNNVHKAQMKDLAQGLKSSDQGYFREIEISQNMTDQYVEGVVADIEKEIARMGRLVSVSKAADPIQAAQQLPASDRAIILKNLKRRNPGSKAIEFSEGWVAERDYQGHLQVKPYAFMSYDDLALNIFYMTTAHTLASSPTDKVFQTIAEAVHTQTGEKWEEGESLHAHYQKKFGLPVTSDLLKFEPRELATWGEQRRTDLVEAIKRKIKLMESHRDNPENWYRLGQKDFRYTFVPVDFLP